ncbi:hypothetical protein SMD44_04815 [Streptomyces alboflavus]|uniref:DUF4232 domain-containing protein n=1 Tax=Streptomyces alboflavus TaxID=67267 RepID=A0A1Z1WFZ2_9ACTN|nr:hypothetical protein [Streptomyces alboflavus]ARX85354.1 hypothetical protein SMD44_04815 [Streptomyces alboflavus]
MRTSRIRTAALAATTAALALATLTACGSSDGGDDAKGAEKSGGAVVSEKASGGKSGAAEGGTGTGGATVDAAKGTDAGSSSAEGATANARKGSGSQASGSKGSGSKASAAGIRACDGQEISYSVTHRFAKQRGEHLLITATNADSKACYVTSFPSVMLGDTVTVLPHSAKDTPAAARPSRSSPAARSTRP